MYLNTYERESAYKEITDYLTINDIQYSFVTINIQDKTFECYFQCELDNGRVQIYELIEVETVSQFVEKAIECINNRL